jgi:hypothetical protein
VYHCIAVARKGKETGPEIDEAVAVNDSAVIQGERVSRIDLYLEQGSAEGDPAHFFRHLTVKQQMYCLGLIEHKGNWQKAAKAAGYSPLSTQEQIEGSASDAFIACLRAIRYQIASVMLLSPVVVAARLQRLALDAEGKGNHDAAIRANVKLGEAMGMFQPKAPSVGTSQTGDPIVIAAAPQDKEMYDDPEIREIMRMNGMDVKPLPERVQDAEVVE